MWGAGDLLRMPAPSNVGSAGSSFPAPGYRMPDRRALKSGDGRGLYCAPACEVEYRESRES